MKRVFKTKTFDRWAKKIVDDSALCTAAREIEAGNFEADLGGGVCKKRVPIPGLGKSGSLRTLVAKKHKDAIIFITGREKSDPGPDFTAAEETSAKIISKSFDKADTKKLNQMVGDGTLKEICNDQQNCQ